MVAATMKDLTDTKTEVDVIKTDLQGNKFSQPKPGNYKRII
jgi:hypothetical protein